MTSETKMDAVTLERKESDDCIFKLDSDFLEKVSKWKETFGFNGLGRLIYYRSYSRLKEGTDEKEMWWETIKRVVEGTYTIQKKHIKSLGLPWNERQGQLSAQEMYERMFQMKFLPAGRGLWAMGTNIIKKKLFASLNNCGFVSTKDIAKEPTKPFRFMMDMSMLGVGVGFDSQGAGKINIYLPNEKEEKVFTIPDSREGWVESLDVLLMSFFNKGSPTIKFDYSKIRPEGQPLKVFGGIASGPKPLIEMHENITKAMQQCFNKHFASLMTPVFDTIIYADNTNSGKQTLENIDSAIYKMKNEGAPISITLINDIMNLIGKCVVSGNVRRSSEISFGPADNDEFIHLKDYKKNPDRMAFGWASNNSIFAEIGMDYKKVAKRIEDNGEPGLAWLDNMRNYSRMGGEADMKDTGVDGSNPCCEQSLGSYELCNLVEVFPTNAKGKESTDVGSIAEERKIVKKITDYDDYLRTLKFAYLYAKTVSLCNTHWPETNAVLLKNRRIGCSLSGIAQFVGKHGLHTFRNWCIQGYKEIQMWDKVYSDWLCVPRSIKTTTVKPSGSISLLAGVTPGIHWPVSRHYIRRVRIGNADPLLPLLKAAGHKIEPCVGNEKTTSVIEFPIDNGAGVRSVSEITMWEQVRMAEFMQQYWSDNQVSITVSFKKSEAKDIAHALDFAQYSLKGISFLPFEDPKESKYAQLPYEPFSEEQYLEESKKIIPIDYSKLNGPKKDAVGEAYCDGDKCVLVV